MMNKIKKMALVITMMVISCSFSMICYGSEMKELGKQELAEEWAKASLWSGDGSKISKVEISSFYENDDYFESGSGMVLRVTWDTGITTWWEEDLSEMKKVVWNLQSRE